MHCSRTGANKGFSDFSQRNERKAGHDPIKGKKLIQLMAVRLDSSALPASFEIIGEDEVRLRMKVSDGGWRSFSASNLFNCFLKARADLEGEGLLLCCQEARPDVFPSGMQQQMDGGRFATVLARSADEKEVVDIFDAAEPSQVASVEGQRVTVFQFFNLKDRDLEEYT